MTSFVGACLQAIQNHHRLPAGSRKNDPQGKV